MDAIPESGDSLVVHVDDSLQIADCDLTAVKINAIPKRSYSLLTLVDYSPECDSTAVKTNAIPKRSDSLLTLVDYPLSWIPECDSTAPRIDVIPESNVSLETFVTENMDDSLSPIPDCDSIASKTDVLSKCSDSPAGLVAPKIKEIPKSSESTMTLVADSLLAIPDCDSTAPRIDVIAESNDSPVILMRENMDDSLSPIPDCDSIASKTDVISKCGDSLVAFVAPANNEVPESSDSPVTLVDDSLLPILDCDSTAPSIDVIPENNDSPVTLMRENMDDSLSPIPDCDSTASNSDVISKCSDSPVALVAPKIPESSDLPVTIVDDSQLPILDFDSIAPSIDVYPESNDSPVTIVRENMDDSLSPTPDCDSIASKTDAILKCSNLQVAFVAPENNEIPESSDAPVTLVDDSLLSILDCDSTALVQKSIDRVTLQTAKPQRGQARKLPDDNVGSPRSRKTVLSRYLTNSHNSCHDVCKYGSRETSRPKSETWRVVLKQNAKARGDRRIKEKPVNLRETNHMHSYLKGRKMDVLDASKGKVLASTNKENVSKQLSARPERNCDIHQKVTLKSLSLHSKGHSLRKEEEVEGEVMKASMKGDRKVLAGTTVVSSPRPYVKPVLSKSLSLCIKRHSGKEEEVVVEGKVMEGDKRILADTAVMLSPRPNIEQVLSESLSIRSKGHVGSGEEEEVEGKVIKGDKRVLTDTTFMLPPRPNIKQVLSKSFDLCAKRHSRRKEDNEVEEKVMKASVKGDKKVLASTTVMSSPKPSIKQVLLKSLSFRIKKHSGKEEDDEIDGKATKGGENVLVGTTVMSSHKHNIKQMLSKSLSFRSKRHSGRKEDDEIKAKVPKASMKGDKSILTGTTGLSSPRSNLRKSKQLKLSHTISQDGRETEAEDPSSAEVPEKILLVVEPENKNKISPGMKNPLRCSPSSSSYGKNRTVTQKLRINRSKDNPPSSSKLTFRLARMLAPQPEVPAPRRLKFKQGARENIPVGKTDTKKPSSSKTAEFGEGLAVASGDRTSNENVKVTLRHKDSKKKENNSSLANEIIGETASKLAPMRKSKVKALVGAFESLIVKDDPSSSSQVSAN